MARSLLTSLAVVAALLLSGASVADAGCYNFSATCDSCTQKKECGWCSSTGECEYGTKSGPSQGSPSCPDDNTWFFDTCPAPTPAPGECSNEVYGECSSCTSAPSGNCGWCIVGDNQPGFCAKGNSSAPVGRTCSFEWMWFPGNCPTQPYQPPPGATLVNV